MADSRKRALTDIGKDRPVHTHDKQPRLKNPSVVSELTDDDEPNETEMIQDDVNDETEIVRPVDTPTKAYFPLKNNGVLVGWACVSPSRLQDVLGHHWGEWDRYPRNEQHRRLHAFVYYDLMKQEKCEAIDHWNNDRRDASDENLIGGSHSDNARNHKKKKGTTSKYHGVSFSHNRWVSHTRYFLSETAAAWFHDQFEREHHPKSQHLNHVEKPTDYDSMLLEGKKRQPKEDRCIRESTVGNLRWSVLLRRKGRYISQSFATKEEAVLFRDTRIQQWEDEHVQEIENREITRNNDGIAYIQNAKTKGFCVLMEDKTWRFLQDKPLHVRYHEISQTYYAFFSLAGKSVGLHLYLTGRLNRRDNLVVDHINQNSLDNRIDNLRVIEQGLNVQNAAPRSKLSPYKGIGQSGKKWKAQIWHKGIQYTAGSYETEVLAANAYNAMATELYAPHIPFLNPVELPDGYVWNSMTKRIVQA